MNVKEWTHIAISKNEREKKTELHKCNQCFRVLYFFSGTVLLDRGYFLLIVEIAPYFTWSNKYYIMFYLGSLLGADVKCFFRFFVFIVLINTSSFASLVFVVVDMDLFLRPDKQNKNFLHFRFRSSLLKKSFCCNFWFMHSHCLNMLTITTFFFSRHVSIFLTLSYHKFHCNFSAIKSMLIFVWKIAIEGSQLYVCWKETWLRITISQESSETKKFRTFSCNCPRNRVVGDVIGDVRFIRYVWDK